MIIKNVYANTQPAAVTVEKFSDGRARVVLSKDASYIETEEGGIWQYEEGSFYLPEGRQDETVESIAESFDAWYAYAGTDHREPSLEERVSALEDVVESLI